MLLADVQRQRGELAAAAQTLRPWLTAVQRGERMGRALLAGAQVLAGQAAARWRDAGSG